MPILQTYQSQAPRFLGVLRFLLGVLFACHGSQKLFGFFGPLPPGALTPLTYTAGAIEFFGGVLIAIGLLTRPVAFLCSGQMAVAYFMGHAGNGFFPKTNGGELAAIYCFIFLYISAQGPGAFALDNLWRKRATATPPL